MCFGYFLFQASHSNLFKTLRLSCYADVPVPERNFYWIFFSRLRNRFFPHQLLQTLFCNSVFSETLRINSLLASLLVFRKRLLNIKKIPQSMSKFTAVCNRCGSVEINKQIIYPKWENKVSDFNLLELLWAYKAAFARLCSAAPLVVRLHIVSVTWISIETSQYVNGSFKYD